MYVFLIGLFQWILVLILLITLSLFFIWTWGGIKSKIPFISVPTVILPDIYKALDLKENSIVYDLGSGDARVLFYALKNNPKAKYIGIENAPFPVILSKLTAWFYSRKNKGHIEIKNVDFFKENLSNATHIFTYLGPKAMDDLLLKFDDELKEGTRLVSATFSFTSKRPIMEIDLKRSKFKLARKLYVYEF